MIDFKEKISRRQFLNICLTTSVAALAAAVVYPVLKYINPPKGLEEGAANSVAAAKVDELPLNSAKIFRFGNKPGILVHTLQDEYKAFSAVCTHLNCTVQYDKDASHIWCACHNGHFDLNGHVISGPPPRPLQQYKVTIHKADIIVEKEG